MPSFMQQLYTPCSVVPHPVQVSLAGTIAWIPWTIKPLYGFISDSCPILGFRRRPYLIVAGLTGMSQTVLT